MSGLILSDAQRAGTEPCRLCGKTDPGRTGSDPRTFLKTALRITRADAPLRDGLTEIEVHRVQALRALDGPRRLPADVRRGAGRSAS